jgi:hypothetical protein
VRQLVAFAAGIDFSFNRQFHIALHHIEVTFWILYICIILYFIKNQQTGNLKILHDFNDACYFSYGLK